MHSSQSEAISVDDLDVNTFPEAGRKGFAIETDA